SADDWCAHYVLAPDDRLWNEQSGRFLIVSQKLSRLRNDSHLNGITVSGDVRNHVEDGAQRDRGNLKILGDECSAGLHRGTPGDCAAAPLALRIESDHNRPDFHR